MEIVLDCKTSFSFILVSSKQEMTETTVLRAFTPQPKKQTILRHCAKSSYTVSNRCRSNCGNVGYILIFLYPLLARIVSNLVGQHHKPVFKGECRKNRTEISVNVDDRSQYFPFIHGCIVMHNFIALQKHA